MSANPHAKEAAFWIVAALLGATAAASYVSISDWPVYTHPDETRKALAILGKRTDYLHPQLMIRLGRLANRLTEYSKLKDIHSLGRDISGLAGGIVVFGTAVLGRTVLPPMSALAAAVAVAVTPLLAVHATFLKEDVYLAAAMVFAVAALAGYVAAPGKGRAILAGLCVGLAASAKYVGLFLLPIALAAGWFAAGHDRRLRTQATLSILIAFLAAFCVVHAPVFLDIQRLAEGFGSEYQHAMIGHDVVKPISLTFGIEHLRSSILPGMGLPLVVLGLAGFAAPLLLPRDRRAPVLLIAATAFLFYLVHEISPLKPHVAERYMAPSAALTVVLGAVFLVGVLDKLRPGAGKLAPLVIVAAAVPALISSHAILSSARNDPRTATTALVDGYADVMAFDNFATFHGRYHTLLGTTDDPPALPKYLFVATSSIAYGRYIPYGQTSIQPERTRRSAAWYAALFRLPYLEITNGGPAFSFLNPVIRIVALDGNAAGLAPIAEEVSKRSPELDVHVVAGANPSVR